MFVIPLRYSTILAAALLHVVILAPCILAGVIYPSLPPGSEYQLLFVTSGVRDATSANIADYNAFVTAQAALNPTLPAGVAWRAVASTALVAARDNAVNPAGIPVFNTNGVELSNGTSTLYNRPLLAAPCYDQFGVLNQTSVWTGSMAGGLIAPGDTLGTISGGTGAGAQETVVFGISTGTTEWIGVTVNNPSTQLNMYALSFSDNGARAGAFGAGVVRHGRDRVVRR